MENPTDYNRAQFREKPIPWANGGRNQVSPLHVAELAAAGAAQHFFTTDDVGKEVYLLGSVHSTGQDGDTLTWEDLGSSREFDFGRSMIACLMGYNWLRFTWVEHLTDFRSLSKVIDFEGMEKILDEETYPGFYDALQETSSILETALDEVRKALAWETSHIGPMQVWCERGESFGEKGLLTTSTPKFDFPGRRTVRIGLRELASLAPERTNMSREQAGTAAIEYLRTVWSEFYKRVETTGSSNEM